VSAKIFLIF